MLVLLTMAGVVALLQYANSPKALPMLCQDTASTGDDAYGARCGTIMAGSLRDAGASGEGNSAPDWPSWIRADGVLHLVVPTLR